MLASELPAESGDFIISTFGLKTFNPDQLRRLAILINEFEAGWQLRSVAAAGDPDQTSFEAGWQLRDD